MQTTSPAVLVRLAKLGLACDAAPLDRLTSPIAALACFPMYMVANVHAWTSDSQFRVPLLDLPGVEAIREAFAIGRAEEGMHLEPAHRRALGTLLSTSRPADVIIYEYALDTLKLYLAAAQPAIAENLRVAVARMIVAAAKASGEGWMGSGPKVSTQEKNCIHHIAIELDLKSVPAAATLLESF